MQSSKSILAEQIETYRTSLKRDLPWRTPALTPVSGVLDFYSVLVSEFMLQQTQVPRVIEKFAEFISLFPSLESLASASQQEVVVAWLGLGYNRRAKFIHQTAQKLTDIGEPYSYELLVSCPGIGPNTAAAIMNYCYNQYHPFVETNIRTVIQHHYFADASDVSDIQILDKLDEVADKQNPREWFYAVMDYGSVLKKQTTVSASSLRSYNKQSTFKGSTREIRAQVLRLLATGSMSRKEIDRHISDERLSVVLKDLNTEGLVSKNKSKYSL